MHLPATLLLITCLGACTRPEDPKDLIAVVLQDFVREKGPSAPNDDIILIRRMTEARTQYADVEPSADDKCPAPKELYVAVGTGNARKESAAVLISSSSKWRMATEAEEKEGFMLTKDHVERRRVGTIVSLSRPGIARNGKQAMVVFSFTWSIHTAFAKYLLVKKGGRWTVSCSDFFYAV